LALDSENGRAHRFGVNLIPHQAPAFGAAVRLALLLAFAGPPASAAQFVLFDATFNYTKQDADHSKPSKSHACIKGAALNPDRPRD